MTWTRTKPIRPGWYWFAYRPKTTEPVLLKIHHAPGYAPTLWVNGLVPLSLYRGWWGSRAVRPPR